MIATCARGAIAGALACVGGIAVLLTTPPLRWALSEARARGLAWRQARAWARAILAVLGVRLDLRGSFPREPAVYVANHSSALDVLLVVALGLPRPRAFLSECVGRAWPLRALGDCLGVFWTVPQAQRGERRRRFAAAARALRASGESVFLSPEGERVRGGVVGPFNRGAFHLALDLERDLVPLRITIPPACDPEVGGWIGPGRVRVEVLPAVSTAAWRLETLARHAAEVRALYLPPALSAAGRRPVESAPCFVPSRSLPASRPSPPSPQAPRGRLRPGVAPSRARATLRPSPTTQTPSSTSPPLRV